ncbi:MAG: formate--tetrahydrofolate ligase [Nitrospirae bacterium]|nr:formate--tetrahydrofolate ligase [Nitrospirota bacterium]
MNNLEFAHSVTPCPILEIAELLGLHHDELVPYGRDKAKISLLALDRLTNCPTGRYVLVTEMNPTPLGEGKTTTAIGLATALHQQGHRWVHVAGERAEDPGRRRLSHRDLLRDSAHAGTPAAVDRRTAGPGFQDG